MTFTSLREMTTRILFWLANHLRDVVPTRFLAPDLSASNFSGTSKKLSKKDHDCKYISPLSMSKTVFSMLGSRPLRDLSNSNISRGETVERIRSDHPQKGQKHYTVAVEGNIGCGKSTLLEYFKKSSNAQAIKEPVEQWTNVRGHNALGLLYQDPSRWSFSFNIYAQLTRVQMHTRPHTAPVKLLERSLYSTLYCFVENDYRNNTINGLEHSVLHEWFSWLTSSQKADLDLIVYLRASPEKCYNRIKKRSRKEESTVPLEFIKDLHNLHEEWLVTGSKFKTPAPVLILDAEKDYEGMVKLYEQHRREILCGYH